MEDEPQYLEGQGDKQGQPAQPEESCLGHFFFLTFPVEVCMKILARAERYDLPSLPVQVPRPIRPFP